ncbi:MAG: PilZ domain-containing protein [Planctomycetota bacterium]|jgi:hypothetical protein
MKSGRGEIVTHQPLTESEPAPPVTERRRDVRLKQKSLHSNLGPVIDLSRSGMRVRSTRRLRGILAVVLFNRNGPHLNVRARVVWTKRIGFRKHVSGLEFIDPPQNMLRELAKLGTTT